jgi:hypothetical protein
MEVCKHENDWGQINQVIAGMVKEIYGNGTRGLAKTVPRLEEKIDAMREDIVLLTTTVSGITKFVSESRGFEKGKTEATIANERESSTRRQKVQIMITAIIGAASIVVTLILKLL